MLIPNREIKIFHHIKILMENYKRPQSWLKFWIMSIASGYTKWSCLGWILLFLQVEWGNWRINPGGPLRTLCLFIAWYNGQSPNLQSRLWRCTIATTVGSYKRLSFTCTFNKDQSIGERWQNLNTEAVSCKHVKIWRVVDERSLFSFK